jgi:hypothetical protein
VLQISATEAFLLAREKAKVGGGDERRKKPPVELRTQVLAEVIAPMNDPARDLRHAARERSLRSNTGLLTSTAPAGTMDSKVLDQYAPGLAQWLLAPRGETAVEPPRSRYQG